MFLGLDGGDLRWSWSAWIWLLISTLPCRWLKCMNMGIYIITNLYLSWKLSLLWVQLHDCPCQVCTSCYVRISIRSNDFCALLICQNGRSSCGHVPTARYFETPGERATLAEGFALRGKQPAKRTVEVTVCLSRFWLEDAYIWGSAMRPGFVVLRAWKLTSCKHRQPTTPSKNRRYPGRYDRRKVSLDNWGRLCFDSLFSIYT